MEKNFACRLCHELPKDVVESSCCNTLFCWICILKTPYPKCPNCLKVIDPEKCAQNLAVSKIIQSLDLPCRYEGCTVKTSLAERLFHEEKCLFRPVLCTNSELCGIFPFIHLEGHLELCGYRKIQCHLCEKYMNLNKFEEHLDNECPEGIAVCPNTRCGESLKRGNIKHHVDHDCLFAEADCPFFKYGCTEKVTRGEFDNHVASKATAHVSLMARAFQLQEVRIDQLQQELAEQKAKLDRLYLFGGCKAKDIKIIFDRFTQFCKMNPIYIIGGVYVLFVVLFLLAIFTVFTCDA